MNPVELHRNPDGVYRAAPVIRARNIRLVKLDADGNPTGEEHVVPGPLDITLTTEEP